jgi:hypothetical protein
LTALSQSESRVPFTRSQRPITEVQLLRIISNITWSGQGEEASFASISDALLRLSGFVGFRFEPAENGAGLSAFETDRPRLAVPGASARSPVSANGRVWGEIRLFFDPNASLPVESPIRLARFMGQQIALLLHRIALNNERKILLSKLEKTRQAILHRKLIHGAAKVLAQQRKISERDAISEIIRYARRNRRSLLNVSESLILGYDMRIVTRPFFRRLARHEPTTKKVFQSRFDSRSDL